MMRFSKLFFILVIGFASCKTDDQDQVQEKLFSLLDSTQTGISFANNLEFDEKFNVYTYRNFYNGGGVAIGDINNDGLVDLYLTANQKKNRLYLNKGDFKFEDITETAGVGGEMGWSTGVSMADVNGDGWLDIYVCNSGDIEGDKKQNELFINNQDNTFTESAREYHLDDKGFSTHASFFDYDKDGDLDVYLLNNSYQAIGSFNLERNERGVRDSLGGDKLLRYNGKFFEDVSEEAGIYGSIIGFGLGVTIGDLNKDGWEDIYVSNDFFERDYLYYNNQDGTFSEQLTNSMNSISGASMGADMADINNDGYPDIFVTEMLPDEYKRLKSVTTFENFDKYSYNVKNGYYHQFTRNTFQLNNANKTFSEIGRLSGVEASDWSWGALIFDVDNDGYKDIFVANGIYQDLTDQDYLNYISNEEIAKSVIQNNKVNYKKLIEIIPSNPISNKAFKNNGNLSFEDKTEALGLDQSSFSNGSAYGDFDNDGDLDLVVNNVNMQAFIYRNNARQQSKDSANYIRFEFKGKEPNTFAVGAQVTVYQGNQIFYIEQQPTRGFQSSMDYRPLVGLPNGEKVKIEIIWPSQKVSYLENVVPNQTILLDENNINQSDQSILEAKRPSNIFEPQSLNISHHENKFVEFNRDRLKYHMSSTEGPKVAVADINSDGLDDFYIGGSKGFSGQLILTTENGFIVDSLSFAGERESEDQGSTFFDADGDGDLDLYVCTGGSEFSAVSEPLKDKLYFNTNGKFELSKQVLPAADKYKVTSVVKPFDYDNDGDIDLFVGERFIPFQNGFPSSGYILQNDGKGNFSNVTDTIAPGLKEIGMITDASTSDIDNDGDNDLVIVGEYLGIRTFTNTNGKFEELETSLTSMKGWWNTIEAVDIDNDGDEDFILGNHGLNSRFKTSKEKPLYLVVDDYDKNGFSDPILAWSNEKGDLYPFALRHNLAEQLKFVLKKYPDYKSFKDATLQQILGEEMFKKALKIEVNSLKSIVAINEGNGKFSYMDLPLEAQLSPIYAIKAFDFDKDGDMDIVLGGNLYAAKPEVGRYDASYGLYLENLGGNKFKTYEGNRGFITDGEVRDIFVIGNRLIIARNNNAFLQFGF
ncbi:MAG: VCBS repeat-containing protein [Fulvivirga sp.]|uniref:VCBS repeat-containing protein n=3 Tax=Fulvivirga sp. TaxID=1931237 RepID=UPI0032EB7D5B